MSFLDDRGLARVWSKVKDYVNSAIKPVSDSIATIAPDGVVDITHGGTGASNDAEARQNMNYLGRSVIESANEDTADKWIEIGSGHTYIGKDGLLNNQPATYGVLENIVTSTVLSQIFTSYTTGSVSRRWCRTGSSNSGLASWKKISNEGDGAVIEKLWQNDDTSKEFARQDITLNLSDYQFIIAFFKASTTLSGINGTVALRGYEARGIMLAGGGTTLRTRSFYPTSNKLTFYGGYQGSTTDDSACIPVAVYGVK